MLSSWWFASRKELFFTKWGPEEKAVLSVTDKMLSDASWLLVQVDVKTVNIPVRGRHEHREKNERRGSEGPPGLEKALFYLTWNTGIA